MNLNVIMVVSSSPVVSDDLSSSLTQGNIDNREFSMEVAPQE